ncbi:MAG: ABC transporter ATP-binding protein [bacterium]
MTDAVVVQGLSKAYQDGEQRIEVLRDLKLVLSAGQTLAIMGPSGSGKSTLLNILAGLRSADEGRVDLCLNQMHYALHTMDEQARTRLRRSSIGYVYQFFNLVPTLTVLENVCLPARLNRRRDLDSQARELLAAFGLKDRHKAFPEVLSGGEQQRVAVARALLLKPPLLLADEPTGNLDAANADQVASLLFDHARALGLTVIVATHSEDVARRADVRMHMNQRGT